MNLVLLLKDDLQLTKETNLVISQHLIANPKLKIDFHHSSRVNSYKIEIVRRPITMLDYIVWSLLITEEIPETILPTNLPDMV